VIWGSNTALRTSAYQPVSSWTERPGIMALVASGFNRAATIMALNCFLSFPMDIAVIVVVVCTTVMDYGWLLGHRIIKGNKCAFYTAAISLFLFILHLEHSPW